MSLLAYILVIVAIIIVWLMRPVVAYVITTLIFLFVGPFYRESTENNVLLMRKHIDKGDTEKAEQLLKAHQNGYRGLKILGFLLLIFYANLSATLIYIVFNFMWVFWVILIGTIIINWQIFVTNMPARYLAHINKKIDENRLPDV